MAGTVLGADGTAVRKTVCSIEKQMTQIYIQIQIGSTYVYITFQDITCQYISSDKRRGVAIEYYGKPHCEGDI